MERIFGVWSAALTLALVAGPAFAGPTPVPVPEPATITLVAVGVGGAIIAKKLRRRK